jgi:hypothetical protein
MRYSRVTFNDGAPLFIENKPSVIFPFRFPFFPDQSRHFRGKKTISKKFDNVIRLLYPRTMKNLLAEGHD